MPDNTAVVHLVRKVNGVEPFRAFVDSYRRVPAGVEHELVLLLKGFDGEEDARPYRELAPDARTLYVPDTGFDLGSYGEAAKALEHGRLCFLNSFSVLRADEWLAKLAAALDEPGVGIAGATGSYGSHLSLLRYQLGLPSRYRAVFTDRRATREVVIRIAESRGERLRFHGPVAAWIGALLSAPYFVGRFDAYPVPHVRTNAFLVPRTTMLTLETQAVRRKSDALELESGRRSLTAQIERSGLRPVVVGADGRVYERDEWAESKTFWQMRQENVLVEDNQTEQFAQGDEALRSFLSRFAWAERARY